MWIFNILYFSGAMMPAVQLGPFTSEAQCWEAVEVWVDKLPPHVEALGTCDYTSPVMLATRGHR